MMKISTFLILTGTLAGLSMVALISCGSDNSPSPSGPSTIAGLTSVTVAGDPDGDSLSDVGSDARSRDGRSDNFSNDNKSNDGIGDGDSSGDGNSFGRASGGYDGVNFRAQVQSWTTSCPLGLVQPCMIIILKNVPVVVVNETEIWDFRDPSRPQIVIEEFQAILADADASGRTVNVKGEGLPLAELDGVSLDGDDVSQLDAFIAIEVDVLP